MQIYLVGGAVRDKLLNFPVYDRDWVVVGATVEKMLELGYQPVGQDFPVFIHPDSGEEYALARTERKSGKGYGGFQYYASPEVSLSEDLLRRDLTINAMAMDDQGQIHDPYQGQKDLSDKRLRHVSPAFSEDPLRVLRVARFAARYHHLGFSIAEDTLQLMRELSATDELEHLTAERIWKEFERALAEPNPEVFLQVLIQCNAIEKVFPELSKALQTAETLTQFKQILPGLTSALTRFACLITLTGKSIDVATLCARLRSPKAFKELAEQCQQQHQNLAQFDLLAAEEKLSTLQSLDLIRRPQRLQNLIPCVLALHPEARYNSLQPILEKIEKIDPQTLIKEGFKGAELGQEIGLRRLKVCAEAG